MENKLMTLEEMKHYSWTVTWSGGKDSTATIIKGGRNNWLTDFIKDKGGEI